MSSASERAGAATEALLAQAEAERTEVEEVLIELAGSLAESDPARLVERLVEATRRTAGASFGIFVPEGSDRPTYVKGPDIHEGMLNRVEAAIRAYDPCLSCSTHAVGQMPIQLDIVAPDGSLVRTLRRD